MAGVTDIVFRALVRSFDSSCLLATEMVSSRGLINRPQTRLLDLSVSEHPVGIQIFGHEPDVMVDAALIAQEAGADFVDINMGCPVPKITKGKDGCALMREPELAGQIVSAVRSAITVPLTVKFRLGWNNESICAVEFAQMLETSGADAVTVHGRTRQQLYSGVADWELIGKVKKAVSIPVFGNGDIFAPEDALRAVEVSGCDGVAVARGMLGSPWLAGRISRLFETGTAGQAPSCVERLIVAYKHSAGLCRYKGVSVGIKESRRHLTHYTKGIPDASVYRAQLARVSSCDEVSTILADLAGKTGGEQGRSDFLFAVEKYNFENSEHPAKRDCDSKKSVKPPVDLVAVSPVAIP